MKQSGVASAVQAQNDRKNYQLVQCTRSTQKTRFLPADFLLEKPWHETKVNQHGKIEQIHQAFRHYVQKQVLLFFGQ